MHILCVNLSMWQARGRRSSGEGGSSTFKREKRHTAIERGGRGRERKKEKGKVKEKSQRKREPTRVCVYVYE